MITTYPYSEDFEGTLSDGTIMNFRTYDMDHTGERICWQNATVNGRNCISHPRQGENVFQECWTISRPFLLDQDCRYTLSFVYMNEYPVNFGENSVWFAVDTWDTTWYPTCHEPSDFTDHFVVSTNVGDWREKPTTSRNMPDECCISHSCTKATSIRGALTTYLSPR